MIHDRTISLTTMAAYALWSVGGGFVVVGYFFALWFTGVGLWLSGIGGVLWIRRMLCSQERKMQAGFELGRDYERDRLRPVNR